MTLEEVAEALERPPYRIKTTHASLGRAERGLQMPPIGLIEALAELFRTDVHSLLNRRPESGEMASGSAGGIMRFWDRAAPDERELIVNLAKRLVKPEA